MPDSECEILIIYTDTHRISHYEEKKSLSHTFYLQANYLHCGYAVYLVENHQNECAVQFVLKIWLNQVNKNRSNHYIQTTIDTTL